MKWMNIKKPSEWINFGSFLLLPISPILCLVFSVLYIFYSQLYSFAFSQYFRFYYCLLRLFLCVDLWACCAHYCCPHRPYNFHFFYILCFLINLNYHRCEWDNDAGASGCEEGGKLSKLFFHSIVYFLCAIILIIYFFVDVGFNAALKKFVIVE